MNRQKLQVAASEWVRFAKNDIRNKVIDFMRENDATQRELAYVLGISDGEMEQIVRGNGEITLTTFAKLLIATGNALEIKPIEETPIGGYDNIPEGPMPPLPRPNPFTRPRMTERPRFEHPDVIGEPFNRPPFPPFGSAPIFGDLEDHDNNEDDEENEPMFPPRDARGRFIPRHKEVARETQTPRNPTPPTSPFETMSRDKLTDIIRKKLWDSEIDVNRASTSELVKFLEEKDKRMKQYKRMSELENDPKVTEFKNRLKNTVNNNPHLKEWVKKFVSGLATE